MSILVSILFIPILGALILFFVPNWKSQLIQSIALNVTCLNFFISLLLWIYFDHSTAKFQFSHTIYSESLSFTIGIDGISLFFIFLTTFLVPVCILVGWKNISNYVKEYCIAFLILEALMIAIFCMLDLLLFYVFFESVLIPMFIIIGVWGSRERKIRAAYQFFIYTLFGSIIMLLGILIIYLQTGTTDYQILYTTEFSEKRQILLWITFFASFAVKVPMVPVHIWLPEAHVEAPTAGSVILAGILLKCGVRETSSTR